MNENEVWDYKFKRDYNPTVDIITKFDDIGARKRFGIYMSEIEKVCYPTSIMSYNANDMGEI